MSLLAIFSAHDARPLRRIDDPARIAFELASIGVRFERWAAAFPLPALADQDTVLAAYAAPVERLKQRHGFRLADVIRVQPDHPERASLRAKFLDEHCHADFEVRFFVEGRGLFCLHSGDQVYGVLCEQGDLISVPAGTRHWFDMGAAPHFTCIRLFTSVDGWVAQCTGDPIARGFPPLEAFTALPA